MGVRISPPVHRGNTILFQYRVMKTVINFIKESIDEMATRVSWPKWGELQSSAFLVVIATGIFALLVWAMDYLFKNGISSIYKYF